MSAHEFFFLLLRDPIALLLLLVVTLVPTGFFGWGLYVDNQIGSEGVTVNARVTWQEDHCDMGSRGSRGSHEYEVNYEFSPSGSQERHTAFWLHNFLMTSVPKEVFDQARETKQIAIQYVPSRPELNRPPDCGATDKLLIFFFLCLGVNLMVTTGVVLAAVYRRMPTRSVQHQDQFAYR